MTADRITGAAALVLGAALYVLAGESEAYLFPRAIAAAIGILGLAIAASTCARTLRPEPGRVEASRAWLRVLPVLTVFAAYRWAMEAVGFYASAFAAFLTIVWIYSPEPLSYRAGAKHVAISAAFTAVVYVLFFVLLRVQTPRGVLL